MDGSPTPFPPPTSSSSVQAGRGSANRAWPPRQTPAVCQKHTGKTLQKKYYRFLLIKIIQIVNGISGPILQRLWWLWVLLNHRVHLLHSPSRSVQIRPTRLLRRHRLHCCLILLPAMHPVTSSCPSPSFYTPTAFPFLLPARRPRFLAVRHRSASRRPIHPVTHQLCRYNNNSGTKSQKTPFETQIRFPILAVNGHNLFATPPPPPPYPSSMVFSLLDLVQCFHFLILFLHSVY